MALLTAISQFSPGGHVRMAQEIRQARYPVGGLSFPLGFRENVKG